MRLEGEREVLKNNLELAKAEICGKNSATD
jgi:hypothetical protein